MRRSFSKKNLWESTPPGVKRYAGGVLRRLPTRFIYGANFQQSLNLIAQSSSWTQEQVVAFQLDKLRETLSRIYEESPYYKTLFDAHEFTPGNFDCLTQIATLPLSDKHTVMDNAESISVQSRIGKSDYIATGGSSGEPMWFYIDNDRSSMEYAHLIEAWSRVGYRLGDVQACFRGLRIHEKMNGMYRSFDPLLNRHYYSNFHMGEESLEKYFSHMGQLGPFYLHTYPSSLNILARFLEAQPNLVPTNVKGLLVGSENIYPEQREFASRMFEAPYLSWYGHSEKLVFAAECEHSTDYHVSPVYGYCELVDEDGQTVTEIGAEGEIVGTGFINKVMPFVRYRTGDFAEYAGDECAHCGRRGLMLRNIRGHNTLEMLVACDRTLIPWSAINMHDDTLAGVRQFQFSQSTPGQATLRLVPVGGPEDLDPHKITSRVNSRLDGRLQVELEFVEEIKLTHRGKAVFVEQNLDLSTYAH